MRRTFLRRPTALLYVSTELIIAISIGWMIGRLKLERFVEPWVYEIKVQNASSENGLAPRWVRRWPL